MESSGSFHPVPEKSPPLGGTFGELFHWHLEWGTRPSGTPNKRGLRWKNEAFETATGYNERNFSNWKKGVRPDDYDVIENAFFGDNPLYDEWRLVLREAYEKLAIASHQNKDTEKPIFSIPARPLNFVGRESNLKSLNDVLDPSAISTFRRAAIHGLGGIGKTSLASEYVHTHRDVHGGVWWSPAETRDGLIQSLADLAAVVVPKTSLENDLGRAARQALDALSRSHEPWLLIYDNVPNPGSISDLLPPTNTSLIITSRFSDWQGYAHPLPLEELSPAESVSVLCEIVGNDDAVGAGRLAYDLGYLPLALNHAGFTCKRTGRSFAHYAALVEAYLDIAPSGVEYPASVFATFKQALKDAASIIPDVEVMIYFLAHFAPDFIPRYLVKGVTAYVGTDLGALLVLEEFSLLKHETFKEGTPAISVHRLVQTVAREQAAQSGQSERYLIKIKKILIDVYPSGDELTPSRRRQVSY